MARIEEDSEEGVAESLSDDLVQYAADLTDPQGAVPLRHRLEIWRDEPLDVIADRGREPCAVLDHEPGATGQRAPDPERRREGVAAFDPPVARAQQAESRTRSGREHHVARQWHPVPVE